LHDNDYVVGQNTRASRQNSNQEQCACGIHTSNSQLQKRN
jgi:hypothetical protein